MSSIAGTIEENEEKIVQLAHDADVFFCEAPFLDEDEDKAQSRFHLTAKQAGILARKAQGSGIGRLSLFTPLYRFGGKDSTRSQDCLFGIRNWTNGWR